MRRGAKGFTMVEVSIASAVFAIVLLVALASFFAIGHLFYKGISITQTQDTTSQIFQDINGNFQTAGNVSPAMTSPSGYHYYCIGNTRYTYNINKEVFIDTETHSAGGSFGLLRDVLHGDGSACAEPCDDAAASCPNGAVKFSNPVEMLGQRMRLEKFVVASGASPNLYSVSIVVAYGDDDVLIYGTPGDYSTVACTPDSKAQQFCSVNKLDTSIYRGYST